MFRASSCPSSGATTTAVASCGLPSERGDSSAVGRGRADRPAVAASGLPSERGGSSVVGRGRADRPTGRPTDPTFKKPRFCSYN